MYNSLINILVFLWCALIRVHTDLRMSRMASLIFR